MEILLCDGKRHDHAITCDGAGIGNFDLMVNRSPGLEVCRGESQWLPLNVLSVRPFVGECGVRQACVSNRELVGHPSSW